MSSVLGTKSPLCIRTILIRTIMLPYRRDVAEHGSRCFRIAQYTNLPCDLSDVSIIWVEDIVVGHFAKNIPEKRAVFHP